ncbi:MAG: methionine--tRNA ligase [Phycisphaerales bacterium]|nr:methionine--tRNA ligase [Phycisphaerales bacterium]
MSERARESAYITTPIYYVNDRPHIGHAYTTTLCDVWARAMRLRGHDVFFLTGTDEHGVKVERSAAARGIPPQDLADENAAEFQRVLSVFGLTNSDFIRTTQPRHVRQVQALIGRLLDSGSVYRGTFEGWYDESQEEYLTEAAAKEQGHRSIISGKPLVRASEENYYFRLSAFAPRLEALFRDNPGFVQPQGRFNEVLGRLRDGLQDVPITRTKFSWGIPFPGDPAHVIYVWIDALLNYVTALGLGALESGCDASRIAPGAHPDDAALARARAHLWPASYHVIGKEILWFHAVVWPAVLMALELPMPRRIHAHSFWIADGQKMSKSLGNFVDLPAIDGFIAHYGLDAWRWYMATQGPLQAADADFRAAHLHEIYTGELVNVVGNCPSRITAMIGKYFGGAMPADASGGGEWPNRCARAVQEWTIAIDSFDLAGAAEAPMRLLRDIDAFINRTEPFKVAKDPARQAELASILAQCAQSVRVAGVLLEPFLPARMADLAVALGGAGGGGSAQVAGGAGARTDLATLTRYGAIAEGTALAKCALFPRVEPAATAQP